MSGTPTGRPRVAVGRTGLPGDGLGRLAARFDVTGWPEPAPPTPAELAELAQDCEGLLVLGSDRVDAALLDAAGARLRVVALASMGYDGIDVAAVMERGVVVTHTPGVLADTTADVAMALILMARRRLPASMDSVRRGTWGAFRMDAFLGLDVHGATLGLIGYGQIARARGLIGAAELALLRPTTTLVNTGRGGVVDEEALLGALRRGELHSAGLDVMTGEPRSPSDPLFAEPHLVVLPHVGSATEATRAAMVDLAARNIEAVLDGKAAPTPVPGTSGRPGTSMPRATS
ncbi:NAD(P)-dependent oxidoreductase [Streptomyces sp. NPDC002324]